jgi:hypothetical protein
LAVPTSLEMSVTNLFRVLDNVAGGIATGYAAEQKMHSEHQTADFENQQRALTTQAQQFSKSLAAKGTVGTTNDTMSESPADIARAAGATDQQIATADAGGAAGYNSLLSGLNQAGGATTFNASRSPAQQAQPEAPSAGMPTPTPVTLNPGDGGFAPASPDTGAGLRTTSTITPAVAGTPGTPGGMTAADIRTESGGNPTAQNPLSTASGLSGMIDRTWVHTVRAHMPQVAQGKSDAEIAALKTTPTGAAMAPAVIAGLNSDNAAALQRAEIDPSPVNVKVAYGLGTGDGSRVITAHPDTPMSQLVSPLAMAENPTFAKMTAWDYMHSAQASLSGSGGTPGSPATTTTSVVNDRPADAATQQGVSGPFNASAPAVEQRPQFGAYLNNAYDTPVGPRITSSPRSMTQGDTLDAIAQNQLHLGLTNPATGGLVGLDTMKAAADWRAKDQANTATQRGLDWTQIQHDINGAASGEDVARIANKSNMIPANINIVSNKDGKHYAWEARDPNLGTTYMVEQGTLSDIKRDLSSIAGDPTAREAFLEKMESAKNEANESAARAYANRASGAAGLVNAGTTASEAPSRIGLNTAAAGQATAAAGVDRMVAAAKANENRIATRQTDIIQQLQGEKDPARRAALTTEYTNLGGQIGAKPMQGIGPGGAYEQQMRYPDGTLTHIDAEGQEVPIGQDSRTWAKLIQGKPIVYNWHHFPDGTSQLGFSSTVPIPNPAGGPDGTAFSTNLNEVLAGLKTAQHPQPHPQPAGMPGQRRTLAGDSAHVATAVGHVAAQANTAAVNGEDAAKNYILGAP